MNMVEGLPSHALDRLDDRWAVLTINLNAICENWRFLAGKVAGECAAVVKANAYGLGARVVAPALAAAGCRHFFVAHLDEALEIKPVLPDDAVVYVLHGLTPGSAETCIESGAVPVLNSVGQIDHWRKSAIRVGRTLPAILQVDTGMCRLGLAPGELDCLDSSAFSGIDLRYLMSHLASAEEQSNQANVAQLKRFMDARRLLPFVPASLANSSGIFLGNDYHFDLARPGAALYGVAPISGHPNPMKPVVTLSGRVIQTRSVSRGDGVGYGGTWKASRLTRVVTVSVGYADGYLRSLSNRGTLNIQGHEVPLIGNVSMDTITCDVTDIPSDIVLEGSLIDLLDPINGVDAVAGRARTIGYEILTSLGHRYARRYVNATMN